MDTNIEGSSPDKLAQPAVRALHGAGIFRLEDLDGRREQEVARLHGMGPRGMAVLKTALREKGLDFEGSRSQQ